ncbi:hypothetical protein N7535_007973 [Penicillium sp. DV-2018c]|nr:hypothetical protein N7535_007973 [Penicillium sp. DV-2018c]
MPVSHITLTVSHLPTSTSFFLSCLQPLGYQFIGRHDDYIGFGQKQGEPADFWMTEAKPGSPPGAVHVAFPAPSKDAVGSFFISALKAGGKIHGEPKLRDSQSGYFSAAVIDFDGNSIEAVYRSRSRSSNASIASASETSGPTMALLESSSRSVVSKASSRASTVKAPSSIAPRSEAGSIARSHAVSKAPTIIDRAAPSVVSQGPPPSYSNTDTMQRGPPAQAPAQAPKVDDGTKAAKTIVGTLIGAAAGAAIAYAMVKGDSQSEEKTSHQHHHQQQQAPPNTSVPFISNFPQIKAAAQSFFSDTQSNPHPESESESQYRALEAPHPPRSTLTRSVTSKNPRASTIYEGTDFYNTRRASEGTIYSIPEDGDIPTRAIEYHPPRPSSMSTASSSHRQSGSGSGSKSKSGTTFISSYHESQPRAASVHSVHSASTIKAPPRRHSHDDGNGSVVSHRSHRSGHSRSSRHAQEKERDGDRDRQTIISSTSTSLRSPRNIPLPTGSTATYYSTPGAGSGSGVGGRSKDSYVSARDVPLPESVLGLDVEVESVGPEDSISQVGFGAGSGSERRSSHSHRSHRSHRREREGSSRRGSQCV